MKYPEFQQIIDNMTKSGYDYKKEIEEIEVMQKRATLGIGSAISLNSSADSVISLALPDHVKAMIYAQLSNNRTWQPIYDNRLTIDAIFSNYDIDTLKKADPDVLVNRITDIRCGNRQIKKQMQCLKSNIETLEKIEKENGSISGYYATTNLVDVIKNLSQSGKNYKLNYMGIPLVCEYLKGVGVEVIKPDSLLCRLLGRLGYSKKIPATPWEAIEICKEIGDEYGLSQAEVDTILWQYCAKDKFEVCTDKPKCAQCGVYNCPSRTCPSLV